MLRQARLAAKDVKTIETGVLNFATLIHDQVDATSSTVPALVSAQAKGLGEVNALQVKDYFNYSGDLFVVTEETYAQRKKQLHAFLAGYETSVRWMI